MAEPEASPGSNAVLLVLVDRILRLTQHDQVVVSLTRTDLDQLQHRATEASETLSLCTDGSVAAQRPAEAAIPALCGLAVECINVVERAELSTVLARLVTAGCEVLAALLLPWAEADGEACSFDWVRETLEDLSDQIDFLALEVYCGLGRLESKFLESDELPVVLDPVEDDFGAYWGSIEHRQALQELSAWLLCVIFRALGYSSVTGRALMEFVNHDLLCLCSLMRGLLAARFDDSSLPHDTVAIQGVALAVLCGLTAPELAFPCSDGSEGDIHEQNRALNFYMEVLAAAMVETGIMESAVDSALSRCCRLPKEGAATGARLLQMLAALLVQVTPDEEKSPVAKLRRDVFRIADKLGRLLEAVSLQGFDSPANLRDIVGSCACLAAVLVEQSGLPEGCSDDHFTLSCRLLVTTCSDALDLGCSEAGDRAGVVAALGALASNVGDLEYVTPRLVEHIGRLPPEDVARARVRLTRHDRHRLVMTSAGENLLALFGTTPVPAPPKMDAVPAPPSKPGLRDIVQNAPKDLRCAIDQKLLCDPVVSPGGVVFERTNLARWLQKNGTCPVTGNPLSLDDCIRSPELRRKVTDWVRGEARRDGKRKK
ncbi:unnamed protein product [Effrenium voratum]|nr:unnamed protein product [Effrenium voratum]